MITLRYLLFFGSLELKNLSKVSIQRILLLNHFEHLFHRKNLRNYFFYTDLSEFFFGTTRNYIIKHKNNKLSIFWYRYCLYLFIFIFKCNGYLYLLFINKETKKLNWYKRKYITKIKLQRSFKCQKWNINQNIYFFNKLLKLLQLKYFK